MMPKLVLLFLTVGCLVTSSALPGFAEQSSGSNQKIEFISSNGKPQWAHLDAVKRQLCTVFQFPCMDRDPWFHIADRLGGPETRFEQVGFLTVDNTLGRMRVICKAISSPVGAAIAQCYFEHRSFDQSTDWISADPDKGIQLLDHKHSVYWVSIPDISGGSSQEFGPIVPKFSIRYQ